MAIFTFDQSSLLGKVRAVDTKRVVIQVNSDENLRRARVGQLVALTLPGAAEVWLIGIIEKVIKTPVLEGAEEVLSGDETGVEELSLPRESVLNTVHVALVGTAAAHPEDKTKFTRSLLQVPEIDCDCHVLRDAQLQSFMGLLTAAGNPEKSLVFGKYALETSAQAYLDGNKLFQRHAALLGSTGSGKSWTVATILEQAAKLPSANLVVFDLHGEYKELGYAKHYRVPGPEDLGKEDEALLNLPYWLLNAEELLAMFVDQSEFTAHNQVMVFQDAVVAEKQAVLTKLKKTEVLNAFTLDSPIPFELRKVLEKIEYLNTERVPGASKDKDKAGPFNGQLSRFLLRMRSKTDDKRYGFLFQAPSSEHEYEAMGRLMAKLMDFSKEKTQVKVIDFSEVPSDVLPVIVGLVARIIYQIQFWTHRAKRKPVVLVCDEAHLYLPKKDGCSPTEKRAVENFERIAKEGRKYGVSLLVISQRPSDVSTTILSQCNNVIALRLTNGEDQSTVRRLMPESLEGLIDVLPVLDVGEALVVGDAVLLPSRICVSMPSPENRPLSATVEFWDEWRKPAVEPDLVQAVENMRRQRRN